MFDRFSRFAGRKAVFATAAVLALTAVAPTASYAGGRHWHGGGGGGVAAAAAIAGIVGTGLAIAATRDAYAYDAGRLITAAVPPITMKARSITAATPIMVRARYHRCGGPYQSAQGGQGSIGSCY